jgi:cytochrome c oxidase cbb3-type subunit 1
VIRVCGGALYLGGMLTMAYNTFMTMRDGQPVQARIPSLLPTQV